MYKNVIAIFFLLCEIVSADCLLYESEAFAIEAADEYRRSCESYGGGGGVFSSSVSENTPNNTCGGYYVENAYVLRVSCNTCGSVTMQEELNANKEYCNALCKVAALSCMTPLNSWGSVLSGEATACGNDDASLPGCSESSSSESVESSSSKVSSSSKKSSSSMEKSSSSMEKSSSSGGGGSSGGDDCNENDDLCNVDLSSSSGKQESSSSDYNNLSSSRDNDDFGYGEYFGHYCSQVGYIRLGGRGNDNFQSGFAAGECVPYQIALIPHFSKRPNYYGNLKFTFLCNPYSGYKPSTGYFHVFTNIPRVITEDRWFVGCYHDLEECQTAKYIDFDYDLSTPYVTYYTCYDSPESTNPEKGCSVAKDNKGMGYTVSSLTPFGSIDEVDFDGSDYMPDGVSLYPANYSFEEFKRQPEVVAAFNECQMAVRREYERTFSSTSVLSSSSYVSSSSFSSPSEEESSSSERSSSSEPPSSSSLSSSSEESSSSSEEIVVESSSVMPVDEPFVAGPDQVYTPDQIFSSGLQNMEPGACYSLNPDRGTIYGWNISYNASDSWWWRKVDCETGKKPVENGIGNCAAFPGSKPDKVSACYAHNGSCYVCDNSKDYIDCNADWLWNYNFPTHSWFKQVDCYNPFEDEDDETEECSEDFVMMKRSSNDNYDRDVSNNIYPISFIPSHRYDVLGREVNNFLNKRMKTNYYSRKSHAVKLAVNKNDFVVSFQAKSYTISNGYVLASTKLEVIPLCEKEKQKKHVYIDSLIMTTSIDTVVIRDSSNKLLINHENKHKQIYENYGNKSWKVLTSVPSHQTADCEIRLNKIWKSFEEKYKLMLTKQNEWDDKDSNNVSDGRIDINSAISDQKAIFESTYFCQIVQK